MKSVDWLRVVEIDVCSNKYHAYEVEVKYFSNVDDI